MERIKRTVVAMALATLPLLAAAQEHISKAIDDFGSDISNNHINMSRVETGDTKAYAKRYCFSLPKKEEKRLDALKKAFYQDASDAYYVFTKTDTDKARKNLRISYGDNLENSIYLGWPHQDLRYNYLYMFVKDKSDENFRYVYGLEWMKKGKRIEGSVVSIYSLSPQKAKTVKKSSNTLSLIGDSIRIDGKTYNMKNGNGTILLRNGRRTTKIDKGNIYIDDGKGNTTMIGSNGDTMTIGGGKVESYSKDSNNEPIEKFNNLRATYMNNIREGNVDNTTLLTGLANYILRFCRTNATQMSADEKALCVEGLQEMQNQTPDKYIKGIFGLSIKAMK